MCIISNNGKVTLKVSCRPWTDSFHFASYFLCTLGTILSVAPKCKLKQWNAKTEPPQRDGCLKYVWQRKFNGYLPSVRFRAPFQALQTIAFILLLFLYTLEKRDALSVEWQMSQFSPFWPINYTPVAAVSLKLWSCGRHSKWQWIEYAYQEGCLQIPSMN